MRRREFISAAGALAFAPHAALGQGIERRRIGILIGAAPGDPVGLGFLDAIVAGLGEQGWIEGVNLEIEARFNGGDPAVARSLAAELLGLGVEAFVCGATQNAVAVRELTTTLPIVFVAVYDPIAAGLVETFARPGGNATGFTNFEPTVGGRWLSLLKEAYPQLRRALYVYNPNLPTGAPFIGSLQEAGDILDVEIVVATVAGVTDIERVIRDAAVTPETGMVLGYDNFMFSNRPAVLEAVNGARLPAIYGYQNYVDEGGLMAYAVDTNSNFRRGGALLGRILSGAAPAELPVQAPERFLLVLNLGVAAALGLSFPLTLLATADRIVE